MTTNFTSGTAINKNSSAIPSSITPAQSTKKSRRKSNVDQLTSPPPSATVTSTIDSINNNTSNTIPNPKITLIVTPKGGSDPTNSTSSSASASSKRKRSQSASNVGSAPKLTTNAPVILSSNSSSTIELESIHMVEKNGEKLRVKVLDTRVTGTPPVSQYYVHYLKYDRRMDEWLPASKLKPFVESNEPSASNKVDVTVKPPTDTSSTASKYLSSERTVTRNMKRKFDEMNIEKLAETDPALNELEKEREEITKVRNIQNIHFGKYSLKTWYFSPYPGEYRNLDTMYVCEFCFKYMMYPQSLEQHKTSCKHRGPPGKLVYSKPPHKIYEMDGKDHKLYCQNLCLFTKFFLDHKTVYFDIGSFKFYVLTQTERKRNKEYDHVLGYFSKEKESVEDYNLACILVLPQYQKKGLGRMLIEFSYELSKLENKIGSPERPLSDLGLLGYKSYWQSVLLDILHHNPNTQLTIRELSLLTSIRQEDIVYTLSSMDMIRYWKGEHIICITPSMIDSYVTTNGIKLARTIDPRCIVGFPNKMGHVTELAPGKLVRAAAAGVLLADGTQVSADGLSIPTTDPASSGVGTPATTATVESQSIGDAEKDQPILVSNSLPGLISSATSGSRRRNA